MVVIPAQVVNHLHPAREAEKGWQKLCQPFSLETVQLKRIKIFPVSDSAANGNMTGTESNWPEAVQNYHGIDVGPDPYYRISRQFMDKVRQMGSIRQGSPGFCFPYLCRLCSPIS